MPQISQIKNHFKLRQQFPRIFFFKLPSVPKKQSRTEPRPNTATNTIAVITSALFNPEQKMFYLFQELVRAYIHTTVYCSAVKTRR